MRLTRRTFLAGGLAAVATAHPRELQASDDAKLAAATAEAQRQIDSGLIRGAVFARGDSGAVGVVGTQCVSPRKIPLTESSRFDLASVTKTLTASACSLLALEGRLDFNAPFTRYLPEHALGGGCTITILDLAQHVGGFSNAKPYEVADMSRFWRELMAKRPVRARRSAFEYACYNYILLGKIVERLTGYGLQAFCRDRVFKPLGMTHIGWGPVADDGRVAQVPWAARTGAISDETANICTFPVGNAGAFSPIDDLRRFVSDLVGRRTFPAGFYDQMQTCGWDDGRTRRSFGWDMSKGGRPDGLSDKAIFHTGFTGQTICADPGTGFSGVVLTVRIGDHDVAIEGRRRILSCLV